MTNESQHPYKEKIEYFLDNFHEDKLLAYIQKSGWSSEFFSDDTFFSSIELDKSYSNNQAAKLLGLPRGQRIINFLNIKEVDFTNQYINPYKIGERYAHDPMILFKFKMIFFLYSKGLNTLEIGHILGLTAPTAVITEPNKSEIPREEPIKRSKIREVVLEEMGPLYDALKDFAKYHEKSVESIQISFTEQLEYTEKMNTLLNHLSTANNEIAILEKSIADLTITATTLTNDLDNFEQIKRLNLKAELMTKYSKEQVQSATKQGFFQRLFGKQEGTTSPEQSDLEKKLLEIDRKSIKNLFTQEEMQKYEMLLKSIKENTDELNKALEYLGSAKERKKHIESQIEQLKNTKNSIENIKERMNIENPLNIKLESFKQSLSNDIHDTNSFDKEGNIEVLRDIEANTIEIESTEIIENEGEKN